MVGFLHASSATQPGDDEILPLQPALWRIGFNWMANRDRIKSLHIPTILVLSDSWSGGPTPPDDYSKYDAFVTRFAGWGAGYNFTWDIWNEPDETWAFTGTRQQFFEAFEHASKDIHTALGNKTQVSGPSIGIYDHAFMQQFLDYCLAQHVQLEVLSWHELSTDNTISVIAEHLKDARTSFLNNPMYRPLGIKKIEINEIIGPSAQYDPSDILAYFYYLEAGGADGACRACWDNNCVNNTLDGILTPDTMKPRAAWWAYLAYAETVKSRVASISGNPNLAVFAGVHPDTVNDASVLISCFADQHSSSEIAYHTAGPVTVKLLNLQKLTALRAAKQVTVVVGKIPNSGAEPLEKPELVRTEIVPITHGTAEISLPAVALHDVYLLLISKPH